MVVVAVNDRGTTAYRLQIKGEIYSEFVEKEVHEVVEKLFQKKQDSTQVTINVLKGI